MTDTAPEDTSPLVEDDEFAAVVYDLDGTLVRLAVDWEAAARDVASVLDGAGVDVAGSDIWTMLDVADEHGLRSDVAAVLDEHEREGARVSTRLWPSDHVDDHSIPVGVCSLNCEAACRIALEQHGLAEYVEAVVGRDSVETWKPDPEPLLTVLRQLGVDPDRAVFVGDSRRDEDTAARAGVAFRYVQDGPSEIW